MSGRRLWLPWKYCECGCHSYEIMVAGRYFKLYWDLKDGWWFSVDGGLEKKYDSPTEPEKIVVDKIAKDKKQIDDFLEAVSGSKNEEKRGVEAPDVG